MAIADTPTMAPSNKTDFRAGLWSGTGRRSDSELVRLLFIALVYLTHCD
jgi:hypothetical protein